MIIYKITNLVNGKIYIGQTIHTLEWRKRKHLQCARKGENTNLYKAIRKYGEDNFIFEVVCTTQNRDELNDLERYYIAKYDTIKHGYNMIDGGDNNVMFVPEIKAKHDKVMRDSDVRKRISESMKKYRQEHPFTEEHKRKLSEKAIGNHNFGTGDTRSIACYCIDNKYGRLDFKNYKQAGLWWYNTYHPFGEKYSQATYQRKIIDCIEQGCCEFRSIKGRKKVFITKDDIRWFRM